MNLENGATESGLSPEEAATRNPSHPGGEETAEEANRASGEPTTEAASGSVVPSPVEGQSRASGKGPSGWFRRHQVLVGVLAGLVTLALLGGMFALGYAVGKPDGEKSIPAAPGYGRPWRESWPAQPYAPLREKGQTLPERTEILRESRDELLEIAASEVGISVDELEGLLGEGKTIATLAEEKGVSTEELVEKLAARITEIADRLGSEGRLTESQAEAVKSRAEALASLFVHGGLRGLRRPLRR